VTDEHIRTRFIRRLKQIMQLGHNLHSIARLWTRFTPSIACTVIGADACELTDFPLNGRPFDRETAVPRVNYNDGRTASYAVDVHKMAIYLHQFARRRELLPCVGESDSLVGITPNEKHDKNECDPQENPEGS
jgi:hypothetical protein